MNGTYQAVSIGDWAKIDDVYRPLPTVVQTWTIESSCSDPQTCDGQVVSDAGWSADIHFQTQTWTLRRTLEHWQPCPDDTVYPGHQLYRFYPMTGGTYVVGDSVLAGDDTTTGEPGACGVGYPTVITLPFRLVRLS
ncbi:hypothetical protein KEK_22009 [Mycolicibacterium thermoresistibile ATCC 19527]|uniref:Uncharacterized protein n=1 Tax=Mycolicibacterium thermoresistibile (strain ATCC 19527 / DSM 44167 / CIP 105390 / JCM 6362 / NCTC 10409 / 316) TaxID=1078020 RepID=G7CN04_MYCT3|nr:hypothetical protein KEK_22009 [Mycolicibacterium thermoresistibile ATCC 19527]